MSSWETASATKALSKSLPQGLVKRARKRTVYESDTPDIWIVQGNPSLSDTYAAYSVTLMGGTRYLCSCQTHFHGETRQLCSHIVGVMLARAEGGVTVRAAPDPTPLTVEIVEPELETDLTGFREPIFDINAPEFTNHQPPWPTKFEGFRPHQEEAIAEIAEAFDDGHKVVMLSAPTGSGKTLIAEATRRLLQSKALYTCTTKTLQAQIMRDFGDYAKLLKGRANYPTLQGGDHVNAGDCTKGTGSSCVRCPGGKGRSWGQDEDRPKGQHCTWCHPIVMCPYSQAKEAAMAADLTVINTAYLLTEANHVGTMSGWPLVIIDEADKLEDELMGHIEVPISPYMRKQLGVGLPKNKTVQSTWVDWLVHLAAAGKQKLDWWGEPAEDDIRARRRHKAVLSLVENVEGLLGEDSTGEVDLVDGWVYTGYEGYKDQSKATVRFKPIMVDQYARRALWSHSEKFLLMSATLVDPQQMAEDLGLDDGEWTTVEVESTFPPHRRKIYPKAAANVTKKTKVEAYPKVVTRVQEIIDENPGKRILVHTVSYELAGVLYKGLRNGRTMTYRTAQEREQALGDFLRADDAVMLAPSFDRGVDLHQDDCRVIVIAKCPYPYLGDKQVAARFYGTANGRQWFVVQAIRTIVQMTGRGLRSADDWCDSYIIDEQFGKVFRQHKNLFPKWWRDAVVEDENDPKWRKGT